MFVNNSFSTEFNTLLQNPIFVDKSEYVDVVERCLSQHNALLFSAPKGLGCRSFSNMLSSFYDMTNQYEQFNNLNIKNLNSFNQHKDFLVLNYDFKDILSMSYNEAYLKFFNETRCYLQSLFAQRKFDKFDLAKVYKQAASYANKKIVIVINNLDAIVRKNIIVEKDLVNWFKVLTSVYESLQKADLLHAVFAFTYADGITDNIKFLKLKSFFKDVAEIDELIGWQGITYDEFATLYKNKNLTLEKNDIYDWCGHYENGAMRYDSVFKLLDEDDLIISVNNLPSLELLNKKMQAGFGQIIPVGDIAFARLLNGERVLFRDFSFNDPRVGFLYRQSAQQANDFKSAAICYTNYLLNELAADGMIIKSTDSDSKNVVAEVVNEEMKSAIYNIISEKENYLSSVYNIARYRDDIVANLEKNQWGEFLGKAFVEYFTSQRKYLNTLIVSAWQTIYNLLVDIDYGYTLEAFNDSFLLCKKSDDLQQVEAAVLIMLEVNGNMTELLEHAKEMRNSSIELTTILGNDSKCNIQAFVYNINIPTTKNENNEDMPISFEWQTIKVE